MQDEPPTLPGADAFATLSLTAQIDLLAASLDRGDRRRLVELAGAPADPAPLVWLLVTLQDDGWLDDGEEAQWLGRYLAACSEARAEIVAEALEDAVEPPHRAGLARALAQAELTTR